MGDALARDHIVALHICHLDVSRLPPVPLSVRPSLPPSFPPSLSLSPSLPLSSLCLPLCLTKIHMRVAKWAPSNEHTHCTHSTLPAAKEAQQQVVPRPWNRALAKKCLFQRAALSSPSLAATWCLRRPVFRTSRRPPIVQPHPIVSFSPSFPLLQPPLVSTRFSCNVLHAGTAR